MLQFEIHSWRSRNRVLIKFYRSQTKLVTIHYHQVDPEHLPITMDGRSLKEGPYREDFGGLKIFPDLC